MGRDSKVWPSGWNLEALANKPSFNYAVKQTKYDRLLEMLYPCTLNIPFLST